MQHTTPHRERRRLASLKPFPRQEELFGSLSDHDLRALAYDIESHGLKHYIEVLPVNRAGLPPDTILAGHQRVRALQINCEKEAEVLVRYDLACADLATVEREFLEDNYLRRQLDPIAKARVALRLIEIERNLKAGQALANEAGEIRDRIGRVIGMSGRNLARYWSLLKAPLEVQNAFREGRLRLILAARVSQLDIKVMEQVASRIRQGGDPNKVVAEFVTAPPRGPLGSSKALATFVGHIQKETAELHARFNEIVPSDVAAHQDALRRTQQFIRKLLKMVEE
jgi:ParB-like chromosome segregation protein Spo0J